MSRDELYIEYRRIYDEGDESAPDFNDWVQYQSVEDETPPAPQATPPAPTMNQADSRHVYVGTDGRGDVYQIVDEGGNVVEWAVPVNAPSTAVISGSEQNLGAPSNMSAAQGGAYNPPPPIGAGATAAPILSPHAPARTASNSRHVYVGTDGRGDVWQIVDEGGDVIEWAVPVNGSSSDAIPGSFRNLGKPSNMSTAQGPAYTPPLRPMDLTTFPDGSTHGRNADGSRPTPPGAQPRLTVPGAVRINSPASNGAAMGNPKKGDARHVYVGRDQRGDVWQIFDGTNVIEWAVAAGDDSRNKIPGSDRNLGAPSAMTIAQDDGTPRGGPVENTFSTSGKSSGGAFITVAGLALTVLQLLK